MSDQQAPTTRAVNIVFDGPPSHDAPRFVEVETDDGRSIRVGEWLERPDGTWALRLEQVITGGDA